MKSYSVSVARGTPATSHTPRFYVPKNAEKALAEDNVIFMQTEDIQAAFNEFFRPAIEEYNAKQKRADRRKSLDYYSEIMNGDGKETAVYEYVVQIGNKDTLGITDSDFDGKHWAKLKEEGKEDEASAYALAHKNTSPDVQEMKAILTEIAQELPERYPNWKFWNIALHMDEPNGSLHLQFDGTPWASGYKNGMAVRDSLSKAMSSMGFKAEGAHYGVLSWQDDIKALVTEKMEKRNYTRQYMSNREKRLEVGEYKRLKAQEKLEQDQAELESGRAKLRKDRAKNAEYKGKLDEYKSKLQTADEQLRARQEQLKERQRAWDEESQAQRARIIEAAQAEAAEIEKVVADRLARSGGKLWGLSKSEWVKDMAEQQRELDRKATQQAQEHAEAMQKVSDHEQALKRRDASLRAKEQRLDERAENLTAEVEQRAKELAKPTIAKANATAKELAKLIGKAETVKRMRDIERAMNTPTTTQRSHDENNGPSFT